MAKKKGKGPVPKGQMHNALRHKKNQMRAAAARMQSKGKLWKKVKGERLKSAGKEKELHFYTQIDSYRAKVGGTDSKVNWLKRIRGEAAEAKKTTKALRSAQRKATLARSKGRKAS